MARDASKSLAFTDEFSSAFGMFFGLWASIELTTDYAICKFLKVTAQEAHLITAGVMYGRKARLLADLIGRSDHPKKSDLLGALNKIRGESKRDVLAHGYIWSDAKTVKFLERNAGGEFKAKEHTFTLAEFRRHLADLAKQGEAFHNALEIPDGAIDEFSNAALSLSRKSKTSPG